MPNKIFVDSNIWLYLFLNDDLDKYKIAEKYMLKNHLRSADKNLVKLFEYAKPLGIYNELKARIEVLL